MTSAPYEWKLDKPPPEIKQHSIAKHEVLRAYLVNYIRTLVSTPHQDELRLTLIDGFAGGGVYLHEVSRVPVLGSPFVFLDAVKEAGFLLNQGRRKPIQLKVDHFFIESNANTYDVLEKTLREQGFAERINQDIHLRRNLFQAEVGSIIDFIKAKGRVGRSIFLLDQCGYKDVPAELVRRILSELAGAEVIVTFAVDALINFASDTPKTKALLEQIGIPDILRERTVEDIKSNEHDFRLFIQSCMYKDLVEACGALFYTLFFIRTDGHGDYWLLHLSKHPRARDVMTKIHWEKNNYSIHYGGPGIDMFHVLGYEATRDGLYTGQADLGFCFDDPAKAASLLSLKNQLPQLIYARPEGMSFGELYASTCNTSPADSTLYKEALGQLVQHKEIEIVGPNGERRRTATTITDRDQVMAPAQRPIVF